MEIRTRAERAQLEKRDAFEAETHDRTLFRVAPAFVPQAAVSLQQLRVFAREPIKTRTAETVLAFHEKTQRHRQFAKRLLIGFDGGQTRDQIAFAVGGAARVKLAVVNRRGERTRAPFGELAHRLDVVMAVDHKCLWPTATLAVD